jgi:hypothetical protein
LTVKSLDELTEVPSRVVRARSGLRMVLHTENLELAVPYPFDGAIIEVKVRDLK